MPSEQWTRECRRHLGRSFRVGIVTHAVRVGGIETVIRCLHRHWTAEGAEVVVIETGAVGECGREFRRRGIRVRSVTPRPWTSDVAHSRRLAVDLREFDFLVLNDARHAQAAMQMIPDSTRAIAVVHSTLPSMIDGALVNADRLDAVVAVSPGVRSEIDKRTRSVGVTVVTIPNGVETPCSLESKSAAHGRELRLVFVGRVLHRDKGCLWLPEIVRRVHDAGFVISLEVVGGGPDLRRLEAMLQEVAPNVRAILHGNCTPERAIQRMRAADVLLLPSVVEGLPMVLLEAMANGVVAVTSALPGQTDAVVENGVSGYLVDVGDVGGFADVVCGIAGDPGRMLRVRENAWSVVRSRFSVESMVRGYSELMLGRDRRPGPGHERRSVAVGALGGVYAYLPPLARRIALRIRNGVNSRVEAFRASGIQKEPA